MAEVGYFLHTPADAIHTTAGANINARSATERTPLLVAASYPGTADLLALLIPEPARAVGPPQTEPATDTPQLPETVRLLIERELAEVLGPIAGLICQEHFAHAGHLDSPNDLVPLLEAIAIEIGDPTKAAGFKHEVLSKFNASA